MPLSVLDIIPNLTSVVTLFFLCRDKALPCLYDNVFMIFLNCNFCLYIWYRHFESLFRKKFAEVVINMLY